MHACISLFFAHKIVCFNNDKESLTKWSKDNNISWYLFF